MDVLGNAAALGPLTFAAFCALLYSYANAAYTWWVLLLLLPVVLLARPVQRSSCMRTRRSAGERQAHHATPLAHARTHGSKLDLHFRLKAAGIKQGGARTSRAAEAAQLQALRRTSVLWAIVLGNSLFLGTTAVLSAGLARLAAPVTQYVLSIVPALALTAFLTRPTGA